MLVEAVSDRDVKTRYGVKKSYSIKADGEWYSAGFNHPAVDKGDQIAFQFEETRFGKEIKKGTIEVLNKASGLTPVKASSKASEFPIAPLARERAIVRQNALGHATELYCNLCYTRPDDPVDFDRIADKVIAIARKFEAYAAGDIEREQVEKETK